MWPLHLVKLYPQRYKLSLPSASAYHCDSCALVIFITFVHRIVWLNVTSVTLDKTSVWCKQYIVYRNNPWEVLTINKNVRQVAPICPAIVIFIVTTPKPITALCIHSAEVNVSMCSTSSPELQHMSWFDGNRIKPYVLIVVRHFLRENVYSTATSSCDLYIW